MDVLAPLYREYLEDYNLGGKEMHLVFFRDAIEHVARINRIIRQPRGNALLVRPPPRLPRDSDS
jgi:dynein heavy chain